MSTQYWGINNGLLLKQKRIDSGLDIVVIAQKTLVSVEQIRQLEDGGDTSFYNSSIKLSIGKKLLAFFNCSLIEEPLIEHAASLNPHKEENNINIAIKNNSKDPLFTNNTLSSTARLLLLSSVFLALIYFAKDQIENFNLDSDSHLKTNHAANNNKVDYDFSTSSSLKETPLIAQELSDAIVEDCNWKPEQFTLSVNSNRKPGNYVHVVSNSSVTLCIKSKSNQTSKLSLAANEERSVFGTAPFIVYSSNLAAVKIYFQGQLIRLPSNDLQQIKLSSAD
jgi:hypothetical protein